MNEIHRLIADFKEHRTLILSSDYLETLKHILLIFKEDKWLLSEMITLPSEKYIGEQMKVIDVDAIHHVREWMMTIIADHLKEHFVALYQANHHDIYQFNMIDVGKRQLKNNCLFYLSKIKEMSYALSQFEKALNHNMTDTIAALISLANTEETRDAALDQFYTRWQHDALVVDKWLSLQATSHLPDTLERVKSLLTHPAFDMKNPNKVYALIAAFTHRNPVRFHASSGKGYEFLTECVLELNQFNPQIAARMLKPLSEWRRYDDHRQRLMRLQLEEIKKQKNISKDVTEIVIKSLETVGETA
jgi:aminopeptidase N